MKNPYNNNIILLSIKQLEQLSFIVIKVDV